MSHSALAVWRWRLLRFLESLGRPGWFGLAALAIAAILTLSVLLPMFRKLQMQEADMRGDKASRQEQWQANIAPAALARLLPPPSAATELAALLPQLAATHQVRLEAAEYQLQQEAGKPLAHYRADLAVTGTYLHLRAWLDALLLERPSLAIDEMRFERSTGDAPEATLRLRATLFMKGQA